MDRSARDQTNALLARLIDSNAELRKEVAGLRKAGEATAKNTEESSKTLNVVTRGGRAIQTEAFT